MISLLKSHPFAVEAHFESSTVLTFSLPKEELKGLIPECLELDTHLDKWAFIAVAMVRAKEVRPKGFPKFIGNSFFLIGYRIFVRYKDNRGKSLRGLYILKSETNKKKMQFLGNIFTQYNYSTTDITVINQEDSRVIKSEKSDFNLKIDTSEKEKHLPENSPFSNWKEARRFAGPLPFTFTYNKVKKEVLIIEGVRQNWVPRPIEVIDYRFSFLEKMNLNHSVLANAFIIENIPYYWKKGKTEQWEL